MPRLAYFIMVHHKPEQFGWLLEAAASDDAVTLVHVDLKSRLGIKPDRRGVMAGVRQACAGKPNVRLLPSRATNWGGWSLSQILLDAIRTALAADREWQFFINLSGQCYPLHPADTIRRTLEERGDLVHVELLPIDSLPPDDWHRSASPMVELPVRAIRLPGRQRDPEGFEVDHKGSQWAILPRAFCEWIVSADAVQPIVRYLRRRLLSDELILQTLLLNSPFRDRVAPHYGREIVWPGPKVLTMADLPRLRASQGLFARKFDAAVDADVLMTLAESGGYRPGPLPMARAA